MIAHSVVVPFGALLEPKNRLTRPGFDRQDFERASPGPASCGDESVWSHHCRERRRRGTAVSGLYVYSEVRRRFVCDGIFVGVQLTCAEHLVPYTL